MVREHGSYRAPSTACRTMVRLNQMSWFLLVGVMVGHMTRHPSVSAHPDRRREWSPNAPESFATTHASVKEIANAVALLRSVGLDDLCHPNSDQFTPFLPQCQSPLENRRLKKKAYKDKSDWFFIANGLCAFLCVLVAALAAGLTMGMMSLDPMTLLIKMRAALTEQEQLKAASLLPLVKQHHRLLVTLLLLNSIANEALPLFLDRLVPSWAAVVCSVTLVLFFGEIIPSAIFTGPNQINISSQLVPVVKLVMLLLSPVAYPIAALLDLFLHDDDKGSFYNRGELTALVRIQYEERLAAKKRDRVNKHLLSDQLELEGLFEAEQFAWKKQNKIQIAATNRSVEPTTVTVGESMALLNIAPESAYSSIRTLVSAGSSIQGDEVAILEGALQMKTKTAMNILTPINHMFAIPYDMVLKKDNMVKIYRSGYSRVPVYEERLGKEKDQTAIRGFLLTKHLIVVNSKHKRIVHSLPLQIPDCVSPKTNLVDLMHLFQGGRTGCRGGHMALVCTKPELAHDALEAGKAIPDDCGFIGIVTLEDVIEELLQEEIYDEMDGHEKKELQLARWVWRKWRKYGTRKKEG